jgi:hypothetical protein
MWLAAWLVLLLFICQSPAWTKSDWVDEDVTNFQLQPTTNSTPNNEVALPAGTISSQAALKGNVSHWSQDQLNDFLLGTGHPYFPAAPIKSVRGLPPIKERHVDPKAFRNWLQSTNASFVQKLPSIDKIAIVEVKGRWDDAGHILHNFGMPSTKIDGAALPKTALRQTKVLIINCGSPLSAESKQVVRNFVELGGFLLTTDWALNDCLTPCFPGYVKWSGDFSSSEVINDAHIVTKDAMFVRGVVSPSYWKLEDKSELVQILSPEVEVLTVSTALAYSGAGSGVLAFSFPYGKGRVLHLVGHIDNNSDFASTSVLADPSIGIIVSLRQAIAANFIASAFDN